METAEIQTLLKMDILIKVVAQAVDAVQRGQTEMAEKGFTSVEKIADAEPADLLKRMKPLAVLGMGLIRTTEGKHEEARALRERALALVDERCASVPLANFHYFMALVLHRQHDYRHALNFWELALQNARPETDPMLVAEMLHEAGECYSRIGLAEYAVIPLRAALKILDKFPEHPWRSSTLLTMGNALRKSQPAEAEACFREAAEIHAAKLELQSAAPAWVNLGILCSEQGRFAESLEFYGKVLRVREGNPATPPGRIATLHNNVANCYRRMKKFDEALAAVDRSISFFPAADPQRAYAYSTKAMTLRDAGRDEEAVTWFRKATETRKTQASPSFEAAMDDLQGQIEALRRLDRDGEVHPVEEELSELRRDRDSIDPMNADREFADFAGGSVLVEISVGSHVAPQIRDEIRNTVYTLSSELMEAGLGRLSGHITLPESRTLIFMGPDAEKLFALVEPRLSADQNFNGAHVIIRQGEQMRDVDFRPRSSSVN